MNSNEKANRERYISRLKKQIEVNEAELNMPYFNTHDRIRAEYIIEHQKRMLNGLIGI